jgi:CheY-like chemotaxis protein
MSQSIGGSILVVDDDVDNCRNVFDVFTDLGYRVDTAQNGEAALRLIQSNPYDVALLDLKMPGMDGLELYREIKLRRSGTVAIIITAYAGSATAERALAAGAWRVMPKPMDIPELLGLVGEAMEQPLVLLVDDDHDLCTNLWEVLRLHGYRTCIASDEPEAVERIQERNYQVILIDLKLQVGEGRRVFDAAQAVTPRTRTILITGARTEIEHHIGPLVSKGADAVCYKPFDMPQLLAALDRLTGKAGV